jgi:hypothetical protein
MSKPVRVAFVMEGPTDYVVLRTAVRALLAGRDFEPTNIWPELDENLRPKTEGGWGGVYKWCCQVLDQAGGPARENPVFALNETWVLVGLFPENEQAKKENIECRWGLEVQLRKYGLMKGKKKLIEAYEANERNLQAAWPTLRRKCSEAERFSTDFLALVPAN